MNPEELAVSENLRKLATGLSVSLESVQLEVNSADPDKDYYGEAWRHAGGRAYWDPKTDKPIIRIDLPLSGSLKQKISTARTVFRHELGHLDLHMYKYKKEASRTREKDLWEFIPDEVDVAVWEYSKGLTTEANLRRSLNKLAEIVIQQSRGGRGEGISRKDAYEKVADIIESSTYSILGKGIRPKYSGLYRTGYMKLNLSYKR